MRVCARSSARIHKCTHMHARETSPSPPFQLTFSIGQGRFPEAKIRSPPKQWGAAFCSLCERGEASPFRRSAPSCWHCSLVACGSGQSLIITGSAPSRVGFVRKQLSVLRGRRRKGKSTESRACALRSVRRWRWRASWLQYIIVCFLCVNVCACFIPLWFCEC